MRVSVTVLIALLASTPIACTREVHQKTFASADEAVKALIAAARSDSKNELLEVLGPDAAAAVDSGDSVQDKQARERFVKAYETSHELETAQSGEITVSVGEDKFPFPFPLIEKEGKWQFDSAAGADELISRRVGQNELDTIQSCLAYVDAQREYYVRNPQGDALMHFASKLISTEGKKDGLYWATSGNEAPSPIGPNLAKARGEGYFQSGNPKADPYHGYMFQPLLKQGANAKGGAYDYLVQDKLLGGFALLAFPADYGNSGVMTFMVNHDGVVYSKDLGPDTAKVAASIDTFDPDSTWKREDAIEIVGTRNSIN